MLSIRKILFTWFTLFFVATFALTWEFVITLFYYNNDKTRNHEIATCVIFIFLIALMVVFSGKYLSQIISKPIREFTDYIRKTIKNDLTKFKMDESLTKFNEINIMYLELHHLIELLIKKDIEIKNYEKNKLGCKELIDNLPQSVFETDEYGKLLYVNKKFLETFGYAASYFAEKNLTIQDVVITDSTDKIYNENTFYEADILAVRSDNSLLPVTIYSSNIYKNNKTKGIRGIIIDNTERMKFINELQEAKNRAEELDNLKTSFLANISNELRTPVNAIFGFSNLAFIPDCSEETRNNYLYHIIDNSEQLLKIIDDVIDISKIETGELNITRYWFDINELITDIFMYFRQLKRKIGKTNIELRLQNDFNIKPCYIYTDPLRLRQVLNNLLNNALKYTDSGYIEFGYSDFGSTIQFYVKDTGIGIPDNLQPIIFDRFHRILPHVCKEYGGKGLSLTITKSLVKHLGGRIWMNSQEGVGTNFYFTINSEQRKYNELHEKSVLDIEVSAN